jgi:hypothetical protein
LHRPVQPGLHRIRRLHKAQVFRVRLALGQALRRGPGRSLRSSGLALVPLSLLLGLTQNPGQLGDVALVKFDKSTAPQAARQ